MGGPYNGCTIDGYMPPAVLIFQTDDGDVGYQLLVIDGTVLPVFELNINLCR